MRSLKMFAFEKTQARLSGRCYFRRSKMWHETPCYPPLITSFSALPIQLSVLPYILFRCLLWAFRQEAFTYDVNFYVYPFNRNKSNTLDFLLSDSSNVRDLSENERFIWKGIVLRSCTCTCHEELSFA